MKNLTEKKNGFINESEDIPEWEKGIKKESIERILSLPPIYPQLKPRLDAKYKLTIITLPRKITTSEFGDGLVMDVEESGSRQSLFVGESIRLALAVHRRRHKLKAIELIGKIFIIQKVEKTIKGEKRKVFLVTFN